MLRNKEKFRSVLFTYFIDENECTLAIHNCHNNAACLNTNGSFACSCNTGYSGNGVKCEGEETLSIIMNIQMNDSSCLMWQGIIVIVDINAKLKHLRYDYNIRHKPLKYLAIFGTDD